MIHVAVLEDDDLEREALVTRMRLHPHASQLDISCFSSARDLAGYVQAANPIDILLTDIILDDDHPSTSATQADARFSMKPFLRTDEPTPTGIDVVKSLFRSGCGVQVIYVTGYDSFHTSVYETEHTCFLLKPIDQTRLDFALDQALRRLAEHQERPLHLHTSQGDRIVSPTRIVFIESKRRVLRIHTTSDEIETYGKLSDLFEKLPPNFVQCHKSFVVNMNHIERMNLSQLMLTTDDVIPISQSRRKATRDAVHAYVRNAR